MSRNSSETRKEILEAASRRFAVTGFKGTSLQDIAGEVGCSKAALLYHFDTKDAILTELLAPALAQFAALDARLAGLPADTVSLAAVEGYVALVMRFRREVTVLHDDIPGILQRPALADILGMTERLLDSMAARSADPEARVAALMVLSSVPFVCMEVVGLDDDELRAALVRTATRTLSRP